MKAIQEVINWLSIYWNGGSFEPQYSIYFTYVGKFMSTDTWPSLKKPLNQALYYESDNIYYVNKLESEVYQ